MQRRLWVLVFGLAVGVGWASPVRAQEDIKPEQLRKMYEDAVANLKAAQDRKNQLAEENEKLKAEVLRLQGEVKDFHARIDALEADAAQFAARTYDMRLHLAAWEQFVKRYPGLRVKWELFLESPIRGEGPPGADVFNPPATTRATTVPPAATTQSATEPATLPATNP